MNNDSTVQRIANAVQDEIGWEGLENENDLRNLLTRVAEELRDRMEREHRSALKQANWETHYYTQR